MDPISTGLAGIALVQKSVEFIKSNINTANDIRDIAGAIDGLFAGEKHIQQERFGKKSLIGQTKDAAASVIDAKLAQEQMNEMRQLVDYRFGFGTWQSIVNERAKRIQEEKQAIAEAKKRATQKKQELIDAFMWGGLIVVGGISLIGIIWILIEVWNG